MTNQEPTNSDILNYLKDFKVQVATDIRTANEEANQNLTKGMNMMGMKMEEMKREVTSELKKDIKKSDEEQRKVNQRMENRMNRLEEEFKRSKFLSIKSNGLRQMANELEPPIRKDVQRRENEENVEKIGTPEKTPSNTFSSAYARQMEEQLNQLKGQWESANSGQREEDQSVTKRMANGNTTQYRKEDDNSEKVREKQKRQERLEKEKKDSEKKEK